MLRLRNKSPARNKVHAPSVLLLSPLTAVAVAPDVCRVQARVLAARDHSGAVPLLEGRTAAGSLIIACGTFLPEGVHQMVDIQPGVCRNTTGHDRAQQC